MHLFFSLETQYQEALELADILKKALALKWEKVQPNKNIKQLIALNKKINNELEILKNAYLFYYNIQNTLTSGERFLSYFYQNELKERRKYFRKKLRYFRQAQKINHEKIGTNTGIHLGPSTAFIAFLKNDDTHFAYQRQRYRNKSKKHIHYAQHYRARIHLTDMYHQFYLTKANYFYLGLFFCGGVLFTLLSVVALLGWPPAVYIMLSSNVSIIALKLTLVVSTVPIFYTLNKIIEIKNQFHARRNKKSNYAKADWHLSHALALDVTMLIGMLFAVALPLFYLMTVPHGVTITLIVTAVLTALSSIQAILVLIDNKRRVGYFGSGLLGSVGQAQESLNNKLSWRKILSFNPDHQTHWIKYLLNPFAWFESIINTVQQLLIRLCEVNTVKEELSNLLQFKLKQNINLLIDFIASPIRLLSLLWHRVLTAFDFTANPYIPSPNNDYLNLMNLNPVHQKIALSTSSNSLLINKPQTTLNSDVIESNNNFMFSYLIDVPSIKLNSFQFNFTENSYISSSNNDHLTLMDTPPVHQTIALSTSSNSLLIDKPPIIFNNGADKSNNNIMLSRLTDIPSIKLNSFQHENEGLLIDKPCYRHRV